MRIVHALPLGLAFVAGLAVSPVAQRLLPDAQAQASAAAATPATSGRFKAIAIKLPPQDPKDTTFVN